MRDPTKCPLCGRHKEVQYRTCRWCRDLVPEYSSEWEKGDAKASEFYVYVLMLNAKDSKRFYVGQTRDIHRRLNEHQTGDVSSTRGREPVLVWYNTVATRAQATALELQLKNTRPTEIVQMISQFRKAMEGELPRFATWAHMVAVRREIRSLRRGILAIGVIALVLLFWDEIMLVLNSL